MRHIGCTGVPADSHETLWMILTADKRARCPHCGQGTCPEVIKAWLTSVQCTRWSTRVRRVPTRTTKRSLCITSAFCSVGLGLRAHRSTEAGVVSRRAVRPRIHRKMRHERLLIYYARYKWDCEPLDNKAESGQEMKKEGHPWRASWQKGGM